MDPDFDIKACTKKNRKTKSELLTLSGRVMVTVSIVVIGAIVVGDGRLELCWNI